MERQNTGTGRPQYPHNKGQLTAWLEENGKSPADFVTYLLEVDPQLGEAFINQIVPLASPADIETACMKFAQTFELGKVGGSATVGDPQAAKQASRTT